MPRQSGDSPYAFTVPPSVEAVPAARDRVVRRAQRLGLILDEELTNDLQLLAGEVIANSVTHTQAACVVSVRYIGERLRVEVTDADPTLVRPSQADVMDENGRGLFLVAALATAWGSQPCAVGKKTWFELAVSASGVDTADVAASQADAAAEESPSITGAQLRIEHRAA
ncbi:ATP-binding protein [Streptomyces zingiberis]|uniref:ATP-binding protein n=1 Tax=Streptomyces zingiberis TaxID=2053010 RepID=A0ABX1C3P7_9ACTN|nr:ATP-binding protein [Streptomyces zingiberis]NJQ03416.1 ATP-binding protein [Streptomyces zingiberis]